MAVVQIVHRQGGKEGGGGPDVAEVQIVHQQGGGGGGGLAVAVQKVHRHRGGGGGGGGEEGLAVAVQIVRTSFLHYHPPPTTSRPTLLWPPKEIRTDAKSRSHQLGNSEHT